MFPVLEQDMFSLALTLAAQEAAAAGFRQITSAHVLIALSKIADAAPPEGAPPGVDALRREFGAFGISPKPFRRHLRSVIATPGASPIAEIVGHRTPQCKLVFALAVRVAADDRVEPGLHHLLRAAMVFLGDVGQLSPVGYTDDIPNEL